MKNVVIDNCAGWEKTVHGPMTEAEAKDHASEMNKIIDHSLCWVEIVDCDE
ncbi:hypothetical protein [Neptuniibacter sp. QD37_11]|uniref:hypothetical protein n=1 Tax=Neptuniibacter sp. QD37_11 TaxID=3398209 RepID=UPI0039F6151D